MTIEAIRLTPDMPSRKFQVLDFLRRFRASHGGNPTLSAIAAACGTNKARVQDAIRKLEHDGLVHRVPGKKGGTTALIDRELVLRELQADGYVINPPGMPLLDLDEDGRLTIIGDAVTNSSLPHGCARAHGVGHGKEAEAGREA